ncbi:hypothetical protein BD414DRAFT_526865 [Trametes punicea]|nr:hypothetical protein BD414DRAFT_526865 [Trametes punicea]
MVFSSISLLTHSVLQLAPYIRCAQRVFVRVRGSLIHTSNCWRLPGVSLRHIRVNHRRSPPVRSPRDTSRPPYSPNRIPKMPAVASPPPQLFFSNDIATMDEWAKRTGIPLTTAEALGTNYARARRWLLSIRATLVQEHGWRDVTPLDSRLLFDIECPTPYRSSRGLPRSPNMRLQLPINASSFFSRERRVQWEMVFHSALFPGLRHTVPAVADLLHLLQCLLTGMVVLIKEEQVPGEGVYRTIRGLPPVEWVSSHEAALVEIFGTSHYRQLFRAASDTRVAFKLERA